MEMSKGTLWPEKRSDYTACCLNFGEEVPTCWLLGELVWEMLFQWCVDFRCLLCMGGGGRSVL